MPDSGFFPHGFDEATDRGSAEGAPLSASLSNNMLTAPSQAKINDLKRQQTRARYAKKRAETIVLNIADLVEKYGLSRIGFLTLTHADDLKFTEKIDWQESQSRYHSFRTHVLNNLFEKHMTVLEPQQNGRIHYHLLVVCKEDIKWGFDFNQIAKKDLPKKIRYSSASPYLKGLWSKLRSKCKLYGLGRSELLPIKSSKKAVADYVGTYSNFFTNNDGAYQLVITDSVACTDTYNATVG